MGKSKVRRPPQRVARWAPLTKEQREEGERGERRVAALFRGAGWQLSASALEHTGSSHDMAVKPTGSERYVLTEVKDETRYQHSGNLCLEMRQGEPPRLSGLAATGAEVWVHILGDKLAAYRVEEMRRVVEKWTLKPLAAGDFFQEGVLFPIEWLGELESGYYGDWQGLLSAPLWFPDGKKEEANDGAQG